MISILSWRVRRLLVRWLGSFNRQSASWLQRKSPKQNVAEVKASETYLVWNKIACPCKSKCHYGSRVQNMGIFWQLCFWNFKYFTVYVLIKAKLWVSFIFHFIYKVWHFNARKRVTVYLTNFRSQCINQWAQAVTEQNTLLQITNYHCCFKSPCVPVCRRCSTVSIQISISKRLLAATYIQHVEGNMANYDSFSPHPHKFTPVVSLTQHTPADRK